MLAFHLPVPDMEWGEWRHRASHAIMKSLVNALGQAPDDSWATHLAMRSFHRLSSVGDLLEPLADGNGALADLPFVGQFRRVINMVADHLEFALAKASSDRKHFLSSLVEHFQVGRYNLLDTAAPDRYDLPLKDAPSIDQFAVLVIRRMNSPVQLGKVMSRFLAIDQAMEGTLKKYCLLLCSLLSFVFL